MSASGWHPRFGLRRTTTIAASFAVVGLFLFSGLAYAVAGLGSGASPSNAGAPAASSTLTLGANTAIGANPLYRAAVDAQLNKLASTPYVQSEPNALASAEKTAGFITNETPSELFASANQSGVLDMISSVAGDLQLTPATAFASWQAYVYEAGIGCASGGLIGGGIARGLGIGVTTYTTVVAEGSDIIATKVDPATFVLSCAIGILVNEVIFQNLIDEAPQINYNGLLGNFEELEWTAYANYLNLTATMYASLASLLVYAQVGFDRAADNAALLQIQNNSFNVGEDLLDSGVAAELGTMATTMEYQFAEDFYTLPELLDGFAAPNEYYGNRGCLVYSGPITSTLNSEGKACGGTTFGEGAAADNIYYNGTSAGVGSPWNATYAGLALGGEILTTDQPYSFISTANVIIPDPANEMLFPALASTSYAFKSATATGVPEGWLNMSSEAGSTNGGDLPAIPLMPTWECNEVYGSGHVGNWNTQDYGVSTTSGCPLPIGIYNISGSNGGSIIIPMASVVPSLSSISIGSFDWAIRYTQAPNSLTSGAGSGCQAVETADVNEWTDSDLGTTSGWSAFTGGAGSQELSVVQDPVNGLQFAVASGTDNCAYFGEDGSAQTSTPWVSQLTTTAESNGLAPYNPQTLLSSTIAGVEINATSSAQAYWEFLHVNLGFTSLGQIPANCIIPAPFASLPSGVNLGTLTANESEELYQAFLRGMGNFYGANAVFSVCHGSIEDPYNWTNLTFDFAVEGYGGVYLNNGTAPVTVSGSALPSESFANTSTWEISACQTPRGTAPLGYCPDAATTANAGVINATYEGSGSATYPPRVVAWASCANATGSDECGQLSGSNIASPAVAQLTVTKGDELVGVEYNGGDQSVSWADSQSNDWTAHNAGGSSDEYYSYGTANVTASGTDVVTVSWTSVGGNTVGAGLVVLEFKGPAFLVHAFVSPASADYSYTPHQANATTLAVAAYQETTGAISLSINSESPSNSGLAGSDTEAAAEWGVYAAGTSSSIGIESSDADSTSWDGSFAASLLPFASASTFNLVKGFNNATLIPIPLIKSVVIPVGKTWPVPKSDPIELFYATRNDSGSVNLTTGGNWSLLSTALLSGNGTADNASDTYSANSSAGDSIYLTGCQESGVWVKSSGDCYVNLSSFSTYIGQIICPTGTNMTVEQNGSLVCVIVKPPCLGVCVPPPTSGCYGSSWLLVGPIVSYLAGWIASVPILGTIACSLALLVAIIILLIVVAIVIAAVVYAARIATSTAGRR